MALPPSSIFPSISIIWPSFMCISFPSFLCTMPLGITLVPSDMVIAWSKDLGRSLDYLETRPEIDRQRLAFYGMSLGAIDGVVLVALEDRFQTAVLLSGGFRFIRVPPEIEPINFAPRVRIPTLLLGGRQDLAHPLETAQKPFFQLLGTPEKDNKHVIFEGGHAPLKIQSLIKDILDWLDRYLGPVKMRG